MWVFISGTCICYRLCGLRLQAAGTIHLVAAGIATSPCGGGGKPRSRSFLRGSFTNYLDNTNTNIIIILPRPFFLSLFSPSLSPPKNLTTCVTFLAWNVYAGSGDAGISPSLCFPFLILLVLVGSYCSRWDITLDGRMGGCRHACNKKNTRRIE